MKNKTCEVCNIPNRPIWKAKTKTTPLMCKSCALKNSTSIGSFKLTTKTSNKTLHQPKKEKQDKSVPELLKLAEIVFNRFIRRRDSHTDGTFRCISCDAWKSIKEMDAGHFYSKTYSATRFSEDNVHGECITCNRFDDDHLIGYKLNLREKIGGAKMDLLKMTYRERKKWTREELLQIIDNYK